MGVAKAGSLKLDFRPKKASEFIIFWFEYILDVIEMLKPQKPCWPYGYLNCENIHMQIQFILIARQLQAETTKFSKIMLL